MEVEITVINAFDVNGYCNRIGWVGRSRESSHTCSHELFPVLLKSIGKILLEWGARDKDL